LLHAGNLGATASFTNLWAHGGFLPFGIKGVLLTLQIVMFAYARCRADRGHRRRGAGPAVALPRATNGIIARYSHLLSGGAAGHHGGGAVGPN